IINYIQPRNVALYLRFLFLGKRRGFANVRRVWKFLLFANSQFSLSGQPILSRKGLRRLSARYDIAFTGSDEVWKVDRMRRFDPSYYLDFCDLETTRICSYAASSSTVTDLRMIPEAAWLLRRFAGLGVRDEWT